MDGKALRTRRQAAGYSIEELAERAQVDERTVRRIEKGLVRPRGSTRRRLAEALGCTLRELTAADSQGAGPAGGEESGIVPHEVPEPPTPFLGRGENLRALRRHLDGGAHGVVICGMGGVGKSALAYALAREIRPRAPDGQLYVDLLGAAKAHAAEEVMRQVLASLLQRLGPVPDEQVPKLYRSALFERRIVLVIDNVQDARQLTPLLHGRACQIIATSRSQLLVQGMSTHALLPLPRTASCQLIETHVQLGARAQELAAACGDLPLAVLLASSCLAQPDRDPDEYLCLLARMRTRLSTLDEGARDRGVEVSLEASSRELPELLRLHLYQLGIFPADFSRDAVAAVWNVPAGLCRSHLARLRQLHLVEHQSGRGASARYRLHDLVRSFALLRLPERERLSAERRHAVHYLGTHLTADPELPGMDPLYPGRITAAMRQDASNLSAAVEWCLRSGASSSAAREWLLRAARDPGLRTLYPADAIRLLEAAISLVEHDPKAHLPDLHLRLGLAYYWGSTQPFVEQILERASRIAAQSGDAAHQALARYLQSLRARDRDDHSSRIQLLDDALRCAERSEDPRLEALMLHAVGIAQLDQQHTAGGERLLSQSLELASRYEDPLGVARASVTLASLWLNRGAAAIAEQHARRAIEGAREADCDCAQYVSFFIASWTSLCGQELDEAESRVQKAMACAQRLGWRNSHGQALVTAAIIALARKQTTDAEARARRALSTAEQQTGWLHLRAGALRVLGEARAQAGDLPGALESFRESLRGFQLLEVHPQIIGLRWRILAARSDLELQTRSTQIPRAISASRRARCPDDAQRVPFRPPRPPG